jgi:ATP-dependent DNA ligase
MLIADGEDIRNLPLHMRKTNLVRMLARRVDGIQTGRDRSGPVPEGLRIRA